MKRLTFVPGRLTAWLCGALVVVGCSSTPEKPKPRPLDPLTPQNVATAAWNQRLANVQFDIDAEKFYKLYIDLMTRPPRKP